MSVAELELGLPATAAGPERAPAGHFPYRPAIVVCLAIGALSLLILPTDLAYDPWSWLIWGRELDRLSLVTRGSASAFKPLAAFIDMIFAPAGRSAPALWLAFVRAATALSMALAFSIGRRLQGVLAGIIAALALLTIWNFSATLALQGMSEPLEMCCCLAALECGLSGRYRAAATWLVAASMLELELTGVLVLYGLIFLVWPAQRRLHAAAIVVLLVMLVGFVWVLPDVVAGHGAFRSEATSAANPIVGGPELAAVPAWATISEIHKMLLWPLVLGWLAELITGAVSLVRHRVIRPLLAPTAIAALFVAGVALLTQLHRATGTTRFLVAACSVGIVAAACIWIEATRLIAAAAVRRVARAHGTHPQRSAIVGATGVTQVVVLLALLFTVRNGLVAFRDSVTNAIDLSRSAARAQTQLPDVIAAAGGAAVVLGCPQVYTGPLMVPHVAWALDVPAPRIAHGPVRGPGGTVVSLRAQPVRVLARARRYRVLASDASWQISSTCRPATPAR